MEYLRWYAMVAYASMLTAAHQTVSVADLMHMCNSKPKYTASKNRWVPVGLGEFGQYPLGQYLIGTFHAGFNYQIGPEYKLIWDRKSKRKFKLDSFPSILCKTFTPGCEAYDALGLCESRLISDPRFAGLPFLAFIVVGERELVNEGDYAKITFTLEYRSTDIKKSVEEDHLSFEVDTLFEKVTSFSPNVTKYGFSPSTLLRIATTTLLDFPLCAYFVLGDPYIRINSCFDGPQEGYQSKYEPFTLPVDRQFGQIERGTYFGVIIHQDYIQHVQNAGSGEIAGNSKCVTYMEDAMCHWKDNYRNDVKFGFCKANKCTAFNRLELTEENIKANIDECATKSHRCSKHAVCVDLPGLQFYRCECKPGVTGKFCEIDVDECAVNSGNEKPCAEHGTCINTVGSYHCACAPGYTGTRCEKNANDCINGPKCVHGKCVLKDGSYQCECDKKYTGKLCDEKKDECLELKCASGSQCVRGPDGKLKCNCPPGYTGKRCETDIDECKENPQLCDRGKCKNLPGSYTCTCNPGFTGVNCETDINECLSNPCGDKGVCTDIENGYECECLNSYTGDYCEKPPDFCQNIVCANGGTCVISMNGHYCSCERGYTGSYCEMKTDYCTSTELCGQHGTCISERNGFRCICDPGRTGEVCLEFTNKCENVKCKNGGKCLMLPNNDYSCNCPKGTSGKHCEIII